MNGFRSICFVHEVEDSYVACYLKQFFKWSGFMYFEYVPNRMLVDMDILRKPENRGFDIMVSLNHCIENNKGMDIAEYYGERFIPLALEPEENPQDSSEKVMDQLMGKLKEKVLVNCQTCAFEELYRLYKKYGMASILYEYTMVLLNKLDDEFVHSLDEKFQKILEEMKQFEADHMPAPDGGMWEYFLFAKFSCQRKVNDLCTLKGWIFSYPIEDFLNNLEEVYKYDPGFFRVEYLKAKVAEQSLMHRVYAKGFYFKGLDKCGVEICKSYLFYQLGKWLEKNMQIYEAGTAYLRSYKADPTNLKAVFKLAVDAGRKKDLQAEKKYLTLMVKNWEQFNDRKQCLPLMELEYAYKSYMLLDKLMRKNMLDKELYNIGRGIYHFTENMGENATQDYFVARLYAKGDREKISHAIAVRMDINCKALVKDEGK